MSHKELLELAIEKLECSTLNEIELTDGAIRVRVVKSSPTIWYNYPAPYPYQYQF